MGATNAAAPPRAAPSSKPYRPASDRHGHLWQLPDGTGLHAPLGTLVRSEDGQLVCCHLCGRWFEHLGAHVRVHGYTAASYKDTFGLLRTKGMVGTELSAAIAARQRDSYTASAEVRQRFESGHEMARSGQLSWLARRAEMSTQGRRAAAEQLSVLRVSRAARRDAALAAVIAETGAADLHAYLRGQYAAGASLDALVRSTGLARAALRAEVAAAGIEVRKAGLNTGAGKQSRALTDPRDTPADRTTRRRRKSQSTGGGGQPECPVGPVASGRSGLVRAWVRSTAVRRAIGRGYVSRFRQPSREPGGLTSSLDGPRRGPRRSRYGPPRQWPPRLSSTALRQPEHRCR
jgi:hypothetical protein